MRVRFSGVDTNLLGGSSEIELVGNEINDILEDFGRKFPEAHKTLVQPSGTLRPFARLYVNGKILHSNVQLKPSDRLEFIQAVAGG